MELPAGRPLGSPYGAMLSAGGRGLQLLQLFVLGSSDALACAQSNANESSPMRVAPDAAVKMPGRALLCDDAPPPPTLACAAKGLAALGAIPLELAVREGSDAGSPILTRDTAR